MNSNRSIVFNDFGDEDILKFNSTSIPKPDNDDLIVKIEYTSLNPIDIKTRKGIGWAAKIIEGRKHKILGMEFSGSVYAPSKADSTFTVGDQVFGWSRFPNADGAYQQYLAINQKSIIKKPTGIDLSSASCIPVAGLTALQSVDKLKKHLGELKNKRVLVIGASGGCGHITVQILNSLEAQVTGVCSSKKFSFLHEIGLSHIIEYDKEERSSSDSYDAVIDFVGISLSKHYVPRLLKGGYWLTVPTVSAAETIDYIEQSKSVAEGILVEKNKSSITELLKGTSKKVVLTRQIF